MTRSFFVFSILNTDKFVVSVDYNYVKEPFWCSVSISVSEAARVVYFVKSQFAMAATSLFFCLNSCVSVDESLLLVRIIHHSNLKLFHHVISKHHSIGIRRSSASFSNYFDVRIFFGIARSWNDSPRGSSSTGYLKS